MCLFGFWFFPFFGFFCRSFVENPSLLLVSLDLLTQAAGRRVLSREGRRRRRRLSSSSSEFLFCVLCVVRTPTAATDTFFVVWLCSTHVLAL